MFLLISSWAPPLRKGSPIMLYNLLSLFPRDSFVILTSGYGFEGVAKSDSQWLPARYFFYNSTSKFGRVGNPARRKETEDSFSERVRKKLNTYFGQVWEIVKVTSQAVKIVEQEKVDFLFTTSTGAPLISTLFTHWITHKPYFVFLFDLYADNLFRFRLEKLLAQIFERPLLKRAKKVIVTNETTALYYRQKYGVRPEVIPNSILVDATLRQKKPVCRKPKSPFTVIFTGAVYWAQKEGICNLIKAVAAIRHLKVKVLLCVPQPITTLKKQGIFPGSCVLIRNTPPGEIQKVISTSADIAFLPLSFHSNAPQIIKTATPGKFSEYLISGVPILVHAPSDSAIARYASASNTALVISENNISELARGIVRLLTGQKLRELLVANSQRLFWRNHDAVKNSARLRAILEI